VGIKIIVMKKVILTILIFFAICNSFGQGKKKEQEVDIVNHEVKFGESVRLLSKKYLVDPSEIYKLNKFAVDGISEGMVLKIPVPRKEGAILKEEISNDQKETVSKEPLKQVEKTEDVAVQDERQKSGGEIKQIIITEDKTEVSHKVLPKETLYSLARDYNVSLDDLKSNNPILAKNGLQIGQVLKILTNKKVEVIQSSSIIKTIPTKEVTKTAVSKEKKPSSKPGVIMHKVEPKETLYSLSKKYNVTVDQIKEQNATLLINGLQIGQVLEIKLNN
jgi:LysM repeat protein